MALSNVKLAICEYDFAVDGGAISDVAIKDTEFIPAGAVVLKVYAAVETAATSGGSATVAVKCGALGVTATTSLGSLAATKTVAFTAAGGTTSPGGNVVVKIATAALTAGKFKIFVEYAY